MRCQRCNGSGVLKEYPAIQNHHPICVECNGTGSTTITDVGPGEDGYRRAGKMIDAGRGAERAPRSSAPLGPRGPGLDE
jgi:hypothetical protein